MKQLLQTCKDSLIAGLDDRAYLVVTTHDAPSVAYELLAPDASDESKQDKNQKQNEKDYNSNEVQAVAISKCNSDQRVWCAVSRRNKLLSLYQFDVPSTKDSDTCTLSPVTTHKTSKRVCCLAFARVPAGLSGGSSCLDVIVAGDLVGDAIAYSLVASDKITNTKSDEKGSDENALASRLLLGHTASVLTGVKVVKDGDVQRILTSDRDEKVRVSQFPQSNVIDGYLLGHTAFIAAMDVAIDSDCLHCITCSGDGTIRLWNYETCQQVDQADIPKAIVKESIQEKAGEHDDQDSEFTTLVPTAISMNPNGNHAAVIFDKCPSFYIYSVSDGGLKHCQTIDCPNQPLAVLFLDNQSLFVMVKEPDYLMLFKQSGGSFNLCPKHDACEALATTAANDGVIMPATLLETDKKGKTRLKLKEKDERSQQKPWNNVERIQVAKERSARRRKRRREALDD